MRQLHLVGFTTDHKQLILSARKGTKSGGFTIALDDHLVALIDEAVRRDDGDDGDRLAQHRRFARQESLLSPREIQSRLRSGRTLAQVAADAGVDEDWIARFAAPILAEQAQVIGRARDLRYATPRKGVSAQPLGTSVRWNVADRGVRLGDDDFDGAWGAYQLRDGSWVVRFSFVSRQRSQIAEWEVDFADSTVTARNRLASNLGYIAPRTRPPSAELLVPPVLPSSTPPVPAPAPSEDDEVEPPARAARKAAKKKAARKKAAKKKAAKKKAATQRGATRAAAKRKATRPAKRPAKRSAKRASATARKRTSPRKAAVSRAAPRQAAKRAPSKKAASKKAATKKRATKKRATKKRATKKAATKRRATKRPAARAARRQTRPAPPALPPAAPPQQPQPEPRPVVAAPEARSLRRARERAARQAQAEPRSESPPLEAVAAADGPAAGAEPVEPDRVVTIRADRARPPTRSELDASSRRRRPTLRQ